MLLINVVSIYFLVMAIVIIYCSAHIRSLNASSYARLTVLLCVAICFYVLGYVMELNADSPAQMLFWNRVEYVGIPFVSALWLTLALVYTRHFNRYRGLLLIAIFGIPIVTLVFRFTNSYHHLYFSSVSYVRQFGTLLLVKNAGPWSYVQLLHSMLMVVITLLLFLYDFIKSEESETGKIILIVSASGMAVGGLILSLVKPFGIYLDYMALSLPVLCLMVILATQRYDFLETKSIARSRVFESGRDAILLVNRQSRVIDCNRSARVILAKLGIRVPFERLPVMFRHYPDLLAALMSPKFSVTELVIDNRPRYYEIRTSPIGGYTRIEGWIKTIRDVTAVYQLNQDLKRQATMDELSGLGNRRAFIRLGQAHLADADPARSPVYLLMMDLDRFKAVNDRYGHQMGDRVIHNFGEILRDEFQSRGLVARIGGEEFAALLPGVADTEACRAADRVRRRMGEMEFRCGADRFHVTVSIGIACMSRPGQTLDNLISLADQSLYDSKNEGRNRVTMR